MPRHAAAGAVATEQAFNLKRASALIPLSREHHDALVFARRAMAAASEPTMAQAHRDRVLSMWDETIESHLCTEEATLLPALIAAGAKAAAETAQTHHDELRRLTRGLRDGDLTVIGAWGEAMRDHVHFEERELFPLAQRVLDLSALTGALDRPAAPDKRAPAEISTPDQSGDSPQ